MRRLKINIPDIKTLPKKNSKHREDHKPTSVCNYKPITLDDNEGKNKFGVFFFPFFF